MVRGWITSEANFGSSARTVNARLKSALSNATLCPSRRPLTDRPGRSNGSRKPHTGSEWWSVTVRVWVWPSESV